MFGPPSSNGGSNGVSIAGGGNSGSTNTRHFNSSCGASSCFEVFSTSSTFLNSEVAPSCESSPLPVVSFFWVPSFSCSDNVLPLNMLQDKIYLLPSLFIVKIQS